MNKYINKHGYNIVLEEHLYENYSKENNYSIFPHSSDLAVSLDHGHRKIKFITDYYIAADRAATAGAVVICFLCSNLIFSGQNILSIAMSYENNTLYPK